MARALSPRQRQGLGYRPDIDGLRAIAVLAVAGFHAFPNWIPGGFAGVDIFFVISGYLITALLVADLRQKCFSLRSFYARRIRRIFPALVLVLFVACGGGWLVLLEDEYRRLGTHVASSALFIVNIVFCLEAGYFDVVAATKPLLHLWSLAVEEQFYLLWPLLLWSVWGTGIRVPVMVATIAVVSFLVNIVELQDHPTATFFLPHTRLWEFVLGSSAVWMLSSSGESADTSDATHATFRQRSAASASAILTAGFARGVMSMVGAVLIVLSMVCIDRDRSYPGWSALVPVLGTLLLLLSGMNAWVNRELLTVRWLVRIGLISYPLYLWHWPLLSIANVMHATPPSIGVRMVLLFTALVLAWLTHRWVEVPMRFGGNGNRKVVLLVVAMLAVGTLGGAVYFMGSAPPPTMHGLMRENYAAFDGSRLPRTSRACVETTLVDTASYCLMSSPTPSVALIGDSHAHALFDYVSRHERLQQKGVLLLGHRGCPPLVGVERDEKGCPEIIQNILQVVNANPQVTEVFITARFAAIESGHGYGNETGDGFYKLTLTSDPSLNDRREIFRTGFERFVQSLYRSGKRVTVVLDAPELDFDPKSCLRGRALEDCAIPRESAQQRQDAYVDVLSAVQARYPFKMIDLMPVLCGPETCPAMHGSHFIYRDAHHLSEYATQVLVDRHFSLD